LAEALLLRRVVVSTNVPAANEILPPEFVAACEDPQALRSRILAALRDLSASRKAFEPVWDRAARVFTLDAMLDSTERLYQDAVAARRAA
jgi:hypothetical protein